MSKAKDPIIVDFKKVIINGQEVIIKVFTPTPNDHKYIVR